MFQKSAIPMIAKNKYSILFIACSFITMVTHAQKDTTKKQTIAITSNYKPVLLDVSKINFSAAQLIADSSKLKMQYDVPAQNLFYTYKPIPLRPLALSSNDSLQLGIRNYLKIGAGNYSTPYVNAGLSLGDGKTSLVNIYGDYISSRGKIKYQDYSKINAKITGSYFSESHELFGSATINLADNYLYGYNHSLYNYSKSNVYQNFQNIALKVGLRNITANDAELNYTPTVGFNIFTLKDKVTENTIAINIPLDMAITENITAKIAIKSELTSYKTHNQIPINTTLNNNLVQIEPEIIYANDRFTLHGGATPSIDNGNLSILPNIYGEMKLAKKSFLLQAGFVGNYIHNTFQNLSSVNPFISPVISQKNTKEVELYGGIKSTIGKHFNFSAKAGLVHFNNLPLYINDTLTDEKSFKISNDANVNDLRLHADMSYIYQDNFTFTGGATFNGYTDMQNNKAAFGTVPIEINASLRWKMFNKFLFKSDAYIFGGGPYLLKNNLVKDLSGGTDICAGAIYEINKNISIWFDVNNILNNKYERWNNYKVYGINVLGGAIIHF